MSDTAVLDGTPSAKPAPARWREYGAGDVVPCPGPSKRRAAQCNRPIYTDVGRGLRILVRVAGIGQRITPQSGCTMRYCRECHASVEILQLPAAG